MGKERLELCAASLVSGCHQKKNSFQYQPVAVIGVDLLPASPCRNTPTWGDASDVVRIMNDANEANSCESGSLDIMKVTEDQSLACSSHEEQLPDCSSFLVLYDLYPSQPSEEGEDDDGGHSGASYSTSNSGTSLGVGAAGSGSGSGKKMDKSLTSQTGGNFKKYVSGTGTSASSSSGTRQENVYQDLFLPKFLYGPPVAQDGEGSVIIAGGPDPLDGLDFSPPNSVFSAPDYTLNMLQVTLGNSNPGTIINHMKKLNAKKCMSSIPAIVSQESPKSKDFDPVVVQCVSLPDGYKIHSIHPTKDGNHILVVLNERYPGFSGSDDTSAMDVDGDELEQKIPRAPSMLLLFALDFSNDVIRIDDIPLRVRELRQGETPVELTLIPLQEHEDREDADSDISLSNQSIGYASVICADGSLRILDLSTFLIVGEAFTRSSKFVSVTYCNSK